MLYQDVNVNGTVVLLEAAKNFDVRKFVFASSSSVYGNNEKVPFSETDNVDYPISPYAATKKAGELLCHTYSHLYGIGMTCLRLFTVYGPRQRPDLAIHKFARLIEAGRPIPVFGDGSMMRDFSYIDDIIDGVVAAMDACRGYEIYNLGESRPVRLDALIAAIEAALGKKAIIQRMPMQPGDVDRTYADVQKAMLALIPPQDGPGDGLGVLLSGSEARVAETIDEEGTDYGYHGQDGSYLTELLLKKGYEVYGIIRRSSSFHTGRIDHLYVDPHNQPALKLVYDLTDGNNLSAMINDEPDEVYNLGAQSHARQLRHAHLYGGRGLLGTLRLLEAVRKMKRPARFYQASSSEMYGKVREVPQNETHLSIREVRTGVPRFTDSGRRSITGRRTACLRVTASCSIMSRRGGRNVCDAKDHAGSDTNQDGLQDKLYLGNLDAKATGASRGLCRGDVADAAAGSA